MGLSVSFNLFYVFSDVPHGTVSKHSSIPAQFLYNWVFVCVSLLEHNRKMKANKHQQLLSDATQSSMEPSKPLPPKKAETQQQVCGKYFFTENITSS